MLQRTHARTANGSDITLRRNSANGSLEARVAGVNIADVTQALLWVTDGDSTQLWLAPEGVPSPGSTGGVTVFIDGDLGNVATVERFLKELAHAGPGTNRDLGFDVEVLTRD